MKNFLYLDIDKMYSLSSQVFEGVTEYVIDESLTESHKSESQQGPKNSGKVVGDIIRTAGRVAEKRFMHDHSYVLFEERLLADSRVVDLSGDSYVETANDIGKKWFVKVRARGVINDSNSTISMIENMNVMGAALTRVTSQPRIEEIKTELDNELRKTKDRNEQARLKKRAEQLMNINSMAKESGLLHDEKFIESLSLLLNYGYRDQLEVQLTQGELIFSAHLKKECLRENESLLIRKYSRRPSVMFVLFGIVTQFPQGDSDLDHKAESSSLSLRKALMNMIGKQAEVENQFFGRFENEFMVDPIALYTEI